MRRKNPPPCGTAAGVLVGSIIIVIIVAMIVIMPAVIWPMIVVAVIVMRVIIIVMIIMPMIIIPVVIMGVIIIIIGRTDVLQRGRRQRRAQDGGGDGRGGLRRACRPWGESGETE